MVDKLLLTPEERGRAVIQGRASVPAYGSGAAEHRTAEYNAVAKAQLAKARRLEPDRICPTCKGEGFYGGEAINDKCPDCKGTGKAHRPDIEEAKKQERERIMAWGIEKCPHWSGEDTRGVGVIKRDCNLCWQALKEGK